MPIIDLLSTRLTDLFADVMLNGKKGVICDSMGQLTGFKGGSPKLHTVSEQGVLLGLPSIQIELPRSVRSLLVREVRYLRGFARILNEVHALVAEKWIKRDSVVVEPDIQLVRDVKEE